MNLALVEGRTAGLASGGRAGREAGVVVVLDLHLLVVGLEFANFVEAGEFVRRFWLLWLENGLDLLGAHGA